MPRAWSGSAPRVRRMAGLGLALGLACGSVELGAQATLALSLGELAFEHGDGQAIVAQGVVLTLPGAGAEASLHVETLILPGHVLSGVSLRCARLAFGEGTLQCVDGRVIADGLPPGTAITLDVALDGSRLSLMLHHAALGKLEVAYSEDGGLRLEARDLQLVAIAPLLPEAARSVAGRADLSLRHHGAGKDGSLTLTGRLTDGRFASADGLQAAEGLGVEFKLNATANVQGWQWQGTASWTAGEAYLHPFYLQAGVTLALDGALRGDALRVREAHIDMDGVGAMVADAELSFAPPYILHAHAKLVGADLATIGPRWIAPLLRPGQSDGLLFAGRADVSLELRDAAPVAADIKLDQIALHFVDEDIAFGPVSGRIPWRQDGVGRAQLEIAGGKWQRLSLGAFSIDAELRGNALALAHLDVPLLDGRLQLHDLAVERGADGWRGQGRAELAPVSMASLSAALGWPVMTGEISAVLPGLRISPGEVRLDGVLDVSVFDGKVTVSQLALFEPFGAASHLSADVSARNLDLGRLTETFSFGGMTGRIDVDIGALELVGWSPTQFDASLRSAPGRYPRRISQRAVQNISALGGAGAMAALQRGFLGMFESFGYREIALSCRLRGGVCEMAGLPGLEPNGERFRIVRGGGVPALDVMGYNRRVDWSDLVGRVRAVIASNMSPVIE